MSAVRPMSGPFRAIPAAALLALAGCGSGYDSAESSDGAVTVAVTDAPSDEIAAFVAAGESFVAHQSTGGHASVRGRTARVARTTPRAFSQPRNAARRPTRP